MNAIAEVLNSIEVMSEQRHENLSISFVSLPIVNVPEIIGFREASDAGVIEIKEIGEGTVPQIEVWNKGSQPVLIPEGTITAGLKQARFLTASIIVNMNARLKVPVACVESDRWGNAEKGSYSSHHMYPSIRMESISTPKAFRRNMQLNVWESIRCRLKESKTNSDTEFIGDYYRGNHERVRAYTRAIAIPATAYGYISRVEGRPVELTIFATPALFRGYSDAMLEATAAEAISKEYKESLTSRKEMNPRQFLGAVKKTKAVTSPSIGLGEEINFKGNKVVGTALVHQGNLIYMGAYAV